MEFRRVLFRSWAFHHFERVRKTRPTISRMEVTGAHRTSFSNYPTPFCSTMELAHRCCCIWQAGSIRPRWRQKGRPRLPDQLWWIVLDTSDQTELLRVALRPTEQSNKLWAHVFFTPIAM